MPSPAALAGRELPAGTARLEPYQNWLLHDAFYSAPGPEPHPVAAFILANPVTGVDLPPDTEGELLFRGSTASPATCTTPS